MAGHFLNSCSPCSQILGQIPACQETGREREQSSTVQVLSCLVTAFPIPCGLQAVSYPSEICELRWLGRVGLPGSWELLQGLGQAFRVQTPLVWHQGLGGCSPLSPWQHGFWSMPLVPLNRHTLMSRPWKAAFVFK